MRMIDGDHLKQWIIARWEESPTTPYPLKAVEILKQIDREYAYDADKAIRDAYKHGKSKGIKKGLAMAQRIKAHWVDTGRTLRWECSNCGRRDNHIYNYCPDCGAQMRNNKGEWN